MTDNKPVTVGEFMHRCASRQASGARNYSDTELVVRRHLLSQSVGGAPVFHVVGMHDGFDWDAGKLFLQLDHDVQSAGAEFEREKRVQYEMSETLGFLYLALTHKHATAAQKLSEVVRILGARTGMRLKDCVPGEVPDVMTSVRNAVDAEMDKRKKPK
jgi:hypothetical protein